jgi:DNA polymerase III epsilon subunit-like protein
MIQDCFDLTLLETLLAQQEQQQVIQGLDAVQHSFQQRKEIEAQLSALASYLHACQQRLHRLPRLPQWQEVQWAQAVLALPNLALLEVDTDGLDEDARVLRVLLLAKDEQVIFETFIAPERPIPDKIRDLNGIQDELANAPSLETVWPDLLAALSGRYVLSYNRPFDLDMLQRAGARIGQSMPVIVGDDLMPHVSAYVHRYAAKLETLCEQFGFPLPTPPRRTAWHRAQGQARLLAAMAQARLTGAGTPDGQDGATDDDDEDEQPF